MRKWISSILMLSVTASVPSVAFAQPRDDQSEREREREREHQRDHERRDREHERADAGPVDAPPSPREERFRARTGYAWISGNYEWTRGAWQWRAGHYERRQRNKRFEAGRWDKQGDHYIFTQGHWSDSPSEPDVGPPPAPIDDPGRPRRGFLWVHGTYQWRDGDYQWISSHYERVQPAKEWVEPHWDNAGGKWVYNAGGWQDVGEHEATHEALHDAAHDGAHRAWSFDSTGWRMLGEKTVDGKVDTDQVDFSQKQGTVSKLTIVVLDSDLEMIDLRVVFVSGNDFKPSGRHYFRENTRTRVIELPKAEILRAIQFKYANVPGGGRARVQVWAKS